MQRLDEILSVLPEQHRAALRWFQEHAATIQPWPDPLPDGTRLATLAKGIYKPSWAQHALSARQTLDGPYPDRDPIQRPDGTWSYMYFQEGDPKARDSFFTNRGLMKCMKDGVPVGVMRQTERHPRALYKVLGLALVLSWDHGYFSLEGFSREGLLAQSQGSGTHVDALVGQQEREAVAAGNFDPSSIIDARERIVAAIVRRRGQPEFRRQLLESYGGHCAISDCNAADALEAAHILPYRGPDTNHPSNGLLLRSDLHTLFDLGLIAIDPTTLQVLVARSLLQTCYAELAGKKIQLPGDPRLQPNREALAQHLSSAGMSMKTK